MPEHASADSRITKLKEKRAHIDAQLKDLAARTREQTRKADARRKIIIGSLALTHMEQHPDHEFTRILTDLLRRYVTKPHDRLLFGLPALSSASSNDPSPQADFTQHA